MVALIEGLRVCSGDILKVVVLLCQLLSLTEYDNIYNSMILLYHLTPHWFGAHTMCSSYGEKLKQF